MCGGGGGGGGEYHVLHYGNMQGVETSASGRCTNAHMHTHTGTHTERERSRKMHIQFDCLLGHTSNQPKKLSTGMHAPNDGIQTIYEKNA